MCFESCHVRRSDGSEASFVRQVDVVPIDMCSHAFTMDVVEAVVEICIVSVLCADFRAVMEVLMSLPRKDGRKIDCLPLCVLIEILPASKVSVSCSADLLRRAKKEACGCYDLQ